MKAGSSLLAAPSTQQRTRQARLQLHMAVNARGQSVIRDHFAQAPLKLLRPFLLDDGRSVLQLLNVGPGVLAGDDYQLEIHLAPHSHVILVNQAANKLHSMTATQSARQRLRIHLGAGARLEYYPGLTVPFPGAHFLQELQVHLAPGSAFGTVESWAMGRRGQGEYLRFQQLRSLVRIYADDRLCYADAMQCCAEQARRLPWGALEGYHYLSSGIWLGYDEVQRYWSGHNAPAPAKHSEQQAEQQAPDEADLLIASGARPQGGIYLRALAQDSWQLSQALQQHIARWHASLGYEALELRRYSSSL